MFTPECMRFTFMYVDIIQKETFDSNVRKLNNIDLYRIRVQTEHVLYKRSGHAIETI